MTEKKQTPPYLSKVKLAKLFEILSSRNLSKVSADELVNYGFGKADASWSLVTLRFLKLIDEAGNVTPLISKLKLKGDAQRDGIKDIVRDAYDELFQRVNDPCRLSSDELFNEFLNVYGISTRIAQAAVPAFLWLCETAGFIEKTPGAERVPRPKDIAKPTRKIALTPARSVLGEENVGHGIGHAFRAYEPGVIELNFAGEIKVMIPNTKDSGRALASESYRDMVEAIENFAKNFETEKVAGAA